MSRAKRRAKARTKEEACAATRGKDSLSMEKGAHTDDNIQEEMDVLDAAIGRTLVRVEMD